MVCLFCNNLTLFFVAKQGTVVKIKNKLRTFQPQKLQKIKNSQPQTKFTGFYKKRECKCEEVLSGKHHFLQHLLKKCNTYFPKMRFPIC